MKPDDLNDRLDAEECPPAPLELQLLEQQGQALAEHAGACGYTAVVVIVETDPEGGRPGTLVTHVPDHPELRALSARVLREFASTIERGPLERQRSGP